jgi:hypothetical protein
MAPYGAESDLTVWTNAANEAYWEGQSLISGTVVSLPAEETFGFSRTQLVFGRTTAAATREDVMVTHLDWAHVDVGVCTPLSSTEMGEVETAIATFMAAGATWFHSSVFVDRLRWFEYQPITTRPGPTVRDTDVNHVGSGATRLPDQLAITSTYRTCSRKHWGRSYWPMNVVGNNDSLLGRVPSSRCTSISNALDTLLATQGAGGGIMACVASIQYAGVMNVKELVVDDVWDVIRRRRAKQASFRAVNSD